MLERLGRVCGWTGTGIAILLIGTAVLSLRVEAAGNPLDVILVLVIPGVAAFLLGQAIRFVLVHPRNQTDHRPNAAGATPSRGTGRTTMTQTRQATRAAWLERTGLRPATLEEAALLDIISDEAFHLIKAIELEKLGIREDEYAYGLGTEISNLTRSLAEYGQLSPYFEQVQSAMLRGAEIMRHRHSGGR
jgi:hypothetical protein